MLHLTDAQRVVLRSLTRLASIAPSEQWQYARRYNANTLYALEKRRLVVTRPCNSLYSDFEVQITQRGREVLGNATQNRP